MRKPFTHMIGIDEVGRGPLAGPVTVAAVVLSATWRMRHVKWGNRRVPLRDSKRLSEKQREAWFRWIKSRPHIVYAVSHVAPQVIDRINISQAANLAATRAFEKLCLMLEVRNVRNVRSVLLDGGLFLRTSNLKHFQPRTIVKGDERYRAIKLASIVAKVWRARYMVKKHKKFPQYGFDRHKGYGTRLHFRALRKHGPSPLHRRTFL